MPHTTINPATAFETADEGYDGFPRPPRDFTRPRPSFLPEHGPRPSRARRASALACESRASREQSRSQPGASVRPRPHEPTLKCKRGICCREAPTGWPDAADPQEAARPGPAAGGVGAHDPCKGAPTASSWTTPCDSTERWRRRPACRF